MPFALSPMWNSDDALETAKKAATMENPREDLSAI